MVRKSVAFRTACYIGISAAMVLLFAGCGGNNGNKNTPTPPPAATPTPSSAVLSSLNCQECHGETQATWAAGPHASTQLDVADELGEERTGQTPDAVLHGDDPEDCIACHSPTGVSAAGSPMTEAQALSYFFSTVDGKFTSDTAAMHTADWPHIACTACHNVPGDHPATLPTTALFDSQTWQYGSVGSTNELCGQCHGSLRFADTDHLTYDAWVMSKHSKTQGDVARELGEERAGQTADDVLHGEDAENCIACHAPTAVLANGGMSEEQALAHFFTTVDGKFSADTAPANSGQWPNVSCTACHDQHSPDQLSYFNSSTKQSEPMASASELCGQCHGSLRFADTDHRSYDILTGTGGMGVPDQQTMPGATCTDCHMFVSDVDGSNSAMFHGHTFDVIVPETGGGSTTSCAQCHPDYNTATVVNGFIDSFRSSFQALDETAGANVAAAAAAMDGVTDDALQAKLAEAQFNLDYADMDESGGFHNHNYLMSLLNDANAKAQEILSALAR